MTPQKLALLRELIDANGGEALFRPSSADRLIGCPGSIVLNARLPKVVKVSTPAQLEGSAAHKVAEESLKGIRAPEEWLGRDIRIDTGESFRVDEEMVDSVALYVDEIVSRESDATVRLIEQRMTLSVLDPTDPLMAENRGTGDCVVINPAARKLSIVDLKYGKGVMVAGDSPQVRNYALMAMLANNVQGGWAEIETVIVQPRAFSERERVKAVSFAPGALLGEFLPELAGAMEAAIDPAAPLRSGSHCKWCNAKDVCPEYRNKAVNLARDAFAAVPLLTAGSDPAPSPPVLVGTVSDPAPKVPHGAVFLPSPLSFDPADIANLLDRFDIYDAFKKAVQQRAAQLIQAGIAVPGWAVEARTGNRRFKGAPADTEKALLALGLKPGDIYTDPKMKSPAQVEKALPKAKRDAIESLVERPFGEPALVRAAAAKISLTDAAAPLKLGAIGA